MLRRKLKTNEILKERRIKEVLLKHTVIDIKWE